jgi:hypothetical protein
MELVMLFLTIAGGLLTGLGLTNIRDKDPLTNTKGMFVAGFCLILLDGWCYLAYNGIFFN